MEFLRRLLAGGGASRSGAEPIDADRRKAALVERLGPAEEYVWHAPIPLFLGGFADVLVFRRYLPGYVYVTCDLIGSGQRGNRLGQYELMICTREPADWAANLISQLARYTLEAILRPGDTMDIGPALPPGARVEALLFCEPDPPVNPLPGLGRKAGVLLCVGILPAELAGVRRRGFRRVLAELKRAGVFPYTDLGRGALV